MILRNILILLYDIGTYDVINATAYPNGSSICVECVFSSAPSAKSCYVSVIGMTSMNKTLVKNSPSDVTVQGCIDNLPAGNYTVYVYDMENCMLLTSRYIIITDILPTFTSKLIQNGFCTSSYLYHCTIILMIATPTTTPSPTSFVITLTSTSKLFVYL